MSPLRRQYLDIKQRYPDALLLFRLGDFYETFDEDAKIASSVLRDRTHAAGHGAGRPCANGRGSLSTPPTHTSVGCLIQVSG